MKYLVSRCTQSCSYLQAAPHFEFLLNLSVRNADYSGWPHFSLMKTLGICQESNFLDAIPKKMFHRCCFLKPLFEQMKATLYLAMHCL